MIIPNSMYALLAEHSMLLADGRHENMGQRFRRDGSSTDPLQLLLVLCTLAGIVTAIWLLSRYVSFRERRRADSPQVLFGELCSAHGLDWSSRQLLNTLARAHRLPNAAQLFLEPQRFDPTNLDRGLARRVDQITALRDHLF